MTCQNVSCGKKNYIPQPPLKVKCGEGLETPDTISKIRSPTLFLLGTSSHFCGAFLVEWMKTRGIFGTRGENDWSSSFSFSLSSGSGSLPLFLTVASSSAEHDLHSNWVLRVPRVGGDSEQTNCANESNPKKKKNQSGSTSSRLRLQRNPIHLPKVVESAFQTLRFKPKLKKQWSLMDIWNQQQHCPTADVQTLCTAKKTKSIQSFNTTIWTIKPNFNKASGRQRLDVESISSGSKFAFFYAFYDILTCLC